MNQTAFETEEFDQQTMSEATERVNGILHTQAQAHGATMIEATRQRKTRSDKGTSKPKAEPGTVRILLNVPVDHARRIALLLVNEPEFFTYASQVQDGIIDQLRRMITDLEKTSRE